MQGPGTLLVKRKKEEGLRKKKKHSRIQCLSKFFDITMTSLCLIILAYHIYVCVTRYLEKQTRIVSDLKPAQSHILPAFTICPSFNKYSYKEHVLNKFNTTKEKFVYEGNFLTNASDPLTVYYAATHNLSEIIKYVYLEFVTNNATESRIFAYPIETNSSIAFINTICTKNFGRCYELILNKKRLKNPVISLTFIGLTDMYVYVHHPGQFDHIDATTKVLSHLGERLFVDITQEISDNEITMSSTCNSKMDFGFNQCLNKKVNEALMNKYGCTVPFITDPSPEICLSDNKTFNRQVQVDFRIYRKNTQVELCGNPCRSMITYMGLPTLDINNLKDSYVKIYVRSKIQIKTSIFDYPAISMMAELGGTSGLLLGVSLITVVIQGKNLILKKLIYH